MSDQKNIIKVYKIRCRGADKGRRPVFPRDEAEEVIVRVYNAGGTGVTCRYLAEDGLRCNPTLRKVNFSNFEDREELGFCLY